MKTRRRCRRLCDRVLSRIYDLHMALYMLPFGGERRFRRSMVEGLSFRPGEWVLDCTCGTGNCAIALCERASGEANVIASDSSRGQLGMAQRKRGLLGLWFHLCDAGMAPADRQESARAREQDASDSRIDRSRLDHGGQGRREPRDSADVRPVMPFDPWIRAREVARAPIGPTTAVPGPACPCRGRPQFQ
jgi:hypothetical protein